MSTGGSVARYNRSSATATRSFARSRASSPRAGRTSKSIISRILALLTSPGGTRLRVTHSSRALAGVPPLSHARNTATLTVAWRPGTIDGRPRAGSAAPVSLLWTGRGHCSDSMGSSLRTRGQAVERYGRGRRTRAGALGGALQLVASCQALLVAALAAERHSRSGTRERGRPGSVVMLEKRGCP